MRAVYQLTPIAIAIILFGAGLKIAIPTTDHAIQNSAVAMDILQAQSTYPNLKGLPEQKLHDMTFALD